MFIKGVWLLVHFLFVLSFLHDNGRMHFEIIVLTKISTYIIIVLSKCVKKEKINGTASRKIYNGES